MSKYGAPCDNLISAKLVTVDGRQVEASRNSNPDLSWAIRGGGGNFGVATQLEYRLYLATDVLAGTMTYAAGRIPELLQAFATFVASAPDEMRVVGEVLPSEQGTRFHMLVCHCGDPRHGIDLLRPLRALKPQADTVRVASYLETQRTINPYSPVAHFQTDLVVPELSESVITTLWPMVLLRRAICNGKIRVGDDCGGGRTGKSLPLHIPICRPVPNPASSSPDSLCIWRVLSARKSAPPRRRSPATPHNLRARRASQLSPPDLGDPDRTVWQFGRRKRAFCRNFHSET